ncbi:hypothetical protein KKHLCK_11265 [Candidatus Electrothrix laxa]
MPYSFFHSRLPKVAERETRSVTLFDHSEFNLPPADYAFLEMFCDEPDCDCRRVFFSVISSRDEEIKAVISWGWEDQTFYTTWMGDNDPNVIKELIDGTITEYYESTVGSGPSSSQGIPRGVTPRHSLCRKSKTTLCHVSCNS